MNMNQKTHADSSAPIGCSAVDELLDDAIKHYKAGLSSLWRAWRAANEDSEVTDKNREIIFRVFGKVLCIDNELERVNSRIKKKKCR